MQISEEYYQPSIYQKRTGSSNTMDGAKLKGQISEPRMQINSPPRTKANEARPAQTERKGSRKYS